jgi:hypothetical protein
LYVFEKHQHAKSASDAAYQGVFFSHHEIEIESGLIERILNKVLMIIKYSGSLFLPVLILNFNNLIHRAKNSNKLVLIGLFLLFIIWLIPNFNKNVVGNLVINLGLGIESTVDMLVVRGDDKHSSNDLLFFILVTIFALGYLLFTLSLASFNLNLKSWKVLDIQKMFIIIVLVLYLLLIGIAKSSFDRYSIYFMLFSVVFFMSKERKFRIRELLVSVFFFALIFLYSVLGTYDYLNAARLKHHILSDLVNKRQVSVNQINAGFEYQLWSGGDEEISWSNWVDYKNKEFIIARNVIPDFEL